MRVLVIAFLIMLSVSCSENSDNFISPLTQEVTPTTLNEVEFLSANEVEPLLTNCFTEEEFLFIAQGFVGFWSEFRDESRLDIQTKLYNLKTATETYTSPIPLSTLAQIYEQELLIDNSNVAAFLSTLVEYKDVISSENFSECFYNELVTRVGEDAFVFNGNNNSRWFIATLAAVLDTCAYIASGVITAPTGVGAVANWGGAIASYGYAMSTIGDC